MKKNGGFTASWDRDRVGSLPPSLVPKLLLGFVDLQQAMGIGQQCLNFDCTNNKKMLDFPPKMMCSTYNFE